MDLDLGGLWSWTVPLWGLFAIVFFLGGVLTSPVKIASVDAMLGSPTDAIPSMGGGARKKTRA